MIGNKWLHSTSEYLRQPRDENTLIDILAVMDVIQLQFVGHGWNVWPVMISICAKIVTMKWEIIGIVFIMMIVEHFQLTAETNSSLKKYTLVLNVLLY